MWSWQRAHPMVSPSQAWEVVATRSAAYSTRYSSSMVPPSWVFIWLRLNPDAMRDASVASGNRSPASCSTVKRSKGMFSLNAPITQSRHAHMCRPPSME